MILLRIVFINIKILLRTSLFVIHAEFSEMNLRGPVSSNKQEMRWLRI